MSELSGRYPPAPESDKGRLGKGSPKIAKSEHRKPYHIPLDVQFFIAAFAPSCLAVLFPAGGRQ
jgi:hypothetical protein